MKNNVIKFESAAAEKEKEAKYHDELRRRTMIKRSAIDDLVSNRT